MPRWPQNVTVGSTNNNDASVPAATPNRRSRRSTAAPTSPSVSSSSADSAPVAANVAPVAIDAPSLPPLSSQPIVNESAHSLATKTKSFADVDTKLTANLSAAFPKLVLSDPNAIAKNTTVIIAALNGHVGSYADFISGLEYKMPTINIAYLDALKEVCSKKKMEQYAEEEQDNFRNNVRKWIGPQRTSISAALMMCLDEKGRDAVIQDPEYKKEVMNNDPLAFWKVITKVYSSGGKQITGETLYQRVQQAEADYESYVQGTEVSLYAFKETLISKKKTLINVGGSIPTDISMAQKLFSKADKARYGSSISDFMRLVEMGAVEPPKNVEEAYNILLRFEKAGVKAEAESTSTSVAYYGTNSKQKGNKKAVRPKKTQNMVDKSESMKGKQQKRNFKRKQSEQSDDSEKASTENKKTNNRDKCYNCGRPGHWAADCRKKKKIQSDEHGLVANDEQYAMYASELSPTEAILDSGSTCHIFKSEKLTDKSWEVSLGHINGVGGPQTITRHGRLEALGDDNIRINANVPVNIVSLLRLEEKNYPIRWVTGEYYEIQFPTGVTMKFNKRKEIGGLYVGDLSEIMWKTKSKKSYADTVNTVVDSTQTGNGFTKQEMSKVGKVKELLLAMNISPNELIKLLHFGAITNVEVTSDDVQRYSIVNGKDIPYLQGRMTEPRPTPPLPLEKVVTMKPDQVFHTDIMFTEDLITLVTVVKPLNMILTSKLASRKSSVVKKAILEQMEIIQSQSFGIKEIHGDLEFEHHKQIGGAIIVPRANHDGIAERNIREIKDRMRSVIQRVPYKVSTELLQYLINYVVCMINWIPREGGIHGKSARELFYGRKLNSKELSISFGDIYLVYDKSSTNSVMRPRANTMIALYPTFNGYKSVKFYSIDSGKIVTSNQYVQVKITEDIIRKCNEIGKQKNTNTKAIIEHPKEEPPLANDVIKTIQELGIPPVIPVPVPPSKDIVIEDEIAANVSNPIIQHLCCTALSVNKANNLYPSETREGTIKEMRQIHHKKVILPVKRKDIPMGVKIIPSHLFCKEKLNDQGETIIKSRFVAGGNFQDVSTSNVHPSYTVETTSIFTMIACAASKGYTLGAMDIEGAYLEASMDDIVYMKIDGIALDALLEIDPSYGDFIHDGKLYVKLLKALYGTVQAAALWFNKISGVLNSLGYTKCDYDECVFKHKKSGSLIALHVDDLLIASKNKTTVENEMQDIGKHFNGFKKQISNSIRFLGMDITNTSKEVYVTMEPYINKIVEEVHDQCKIPSRLDMFDDDDSEELSEKDKKTFHSGVARLLYLSKRVRPDILVNVSHLASCVNNPTKRNYYEYRKILKYLKSCPSLGYRYDKNCDIDPTCYADASHMTHTDIKSRTGFVLMLSGGVIGAWSTKQDMISRSATESELIALNTAVLHCENLHHILSFMVNSKTPIKIFQDNQGLLNLLGDRKITNVRTKHLRNRLEKVKELIRSKVINTTWIKTGDMIADILTKPTCGKVFHERVKKMVKPRTKLVSKN